MKKLCLLFNVTVVNVVLFSGAALADADQWHSLSKDKSPHAEGGCASKGKIAQFHQFHQKKGQQVKVPNSADGANSADARSQKENNEPTLDQFI